ncbi:MAG: YlbF family regulator [Bacilli bacterium]|nr:YlbF family regulator [Bacilli bacterium]
MNNPVDSAKALKKEIEELPEVKEYLSLKDLLENDKELQELRTNIARLESEGKLEEKKNLLEIYNSHPLIVNFNILKDEVKNILSEINDILNA